MGTPAFNLVIVQGSKQELDEFEKVAYKNESETFCMEQLLPLPEYLAGEDKMSDEVQAFSHIVYGSKWVAAFAILIEKTNSYLKYYFNSKYTKANLDYIAIKYSKLKFTHVFVEIELTKCGVIEYNNGKKTLEVSVYDENMDWHIASDKYTYLYIEELYQKLLLVFLGEPEILKSMYFSPSHNQYDFFEIFKKREYLRDHEGFYESLYDMERDLEQRGLDYARNEIFYRFRTNDIYYQRMFINQNFLSSEKKKQYLNNIKTKINEN